MNSVILYVATLLISGVSAPANDQFYVEGDVVSPGKFATTGKERVRSAITQAGGFATTADRSNIRLIRDGQVLRVNDDPDTDYLMRPGDRLVIFRKVPRPASP